MYDFTQSAGAVSLEGCKAIHEGGTGPGFPGVLRLGVLLIRLVGAARWHFLAWQHDDGGDGHADHRGLPGGERRRHHDDEDPQQGRGY